MAGFQTIFPMVVAFALGAAPFVGGPAAVAQTPNAQPASLDLGDHKRGDHKQGKAASTQISNKWVCLTGMRLEVMPVSHDVSDAPEEWVLVYKQNGKPISAQKISASEARSIQTFDCGPDPSARARGDASLVG